MYHNEPSLCLKALGLYGIECLQISGQINVTLRNERIKAFNNADDKGPRVLLVSNVGTVGLNIDRACILIFLVKC